MRKLIVGLGALVIPAMVAGLATSGCDEASNAAAAACGPCGSVVRGDVSISGDARLDGFFAAVGDLGKATGKINADFEANLAELEAIFGIAAEAGGSASISGRIDALVAKIQGEIQANASGGLQIAYAPPKCSANIDIAVEAQANCEAKAECTVEANPGSVSVACEGECTGGCEGGCAAEATAKCEVSGGSVDCSGSCEGTCTMELQAAAACSGTCNGTCTGTCSAQNADGSCAGSCDGTCQGSCSVTGSAAANCTGKCSGSCTVDAPAGGCEAGATAKCEGKCEGSCSGGCTGEATPPSASADCEASADCQASASAQGSANLECTPPSLDIQFAFTGGVAGNASATAAAQAEFNAKIEALKVKGAAMLQGLAKYEMLFKGDTELGIQPPVGKIQTQLEGFVSAAASGDFGFDIPSGRLLCLPTAFEEAVTVLGTMASEASGNISAQVKFAGALTSGFSG